MYLGEYRLQDFMTYGHQCIGGKILCSFPGREFTAAAGGRHIAGDCPAQGRAYGSGVAGGAVKMVVAIAVGCFHAVLAGHG